LLHFSKARVVNGLHRARIRIRELFISDSA
jgi:hypothetical protein